MVKILVTFLPFASVGLSFIQTITLTMDSGGNEMCCSWKAFVIAVRLINSFLYFARNGTMRVMNRLES